MFSGFFHLSEANGEATITSESELTSFTKYIFHRLEKAKIKYTNMLPRHALQNLTETHSKQALLDLSLFLSNPLAKGKHLNDRTQKRQQWPSPSLIGKTNPERPPQVQQKREASKERFGRDLNYLHKASNIQVPSLTVYSPPKREVQSGPSDWNIGSLNHLTNLRWGPLPTTKRLGFLPQE